MFKSIYSGHIHEYDSNDKFVSSRKIVGSDYYIDEPVLSTLIETVKIKHGDEYVFMKPNEDGYNILKWKKRLIYTLEYDQKLYIVGYLTIVWNDRFLDEEEISDVLELEKNIKIKMEEDVKNEKTK